MVSAKDYSNGPATPPPTRPRAGARAASASPVTVLPMDPATETERLREALARAEQFNKALLSTVSDPIFELRKDGLILSFRAPKDNEFQLTPEAVVGRRLMDMLPTQIGQLAMHYLEKTLRTGQPQHFSCQHHFPGRLRCFETRLAVGAGGCAVAVVRDVTAHETLEREVVESSNRVQMRIGQDIHDGLGQHLTGISFLSRALEKNLAARNLPEANDAAEISRLVLGALEQTRILARGLFPVEIGTHDFAESLRELAGTVEQLFQVSCIVECDPAVAIQDRNVSTHLFRLAQEAINNAVKHGKAQRIVISLRAAEDGYVLRIDDDGTGLPAEGARRTGLGLRIMNYRAQKVGGALDIRPGDCGGTVVQCAFTLNHDEN